MPDIYAFLAAHAIPYDRHDHVAVFTCEESDKLPPLPGAPTKNLFLKDEKGVRYFLVTVGHEKRVDLKALGSMLDAKGLSFGSPEKMKELLGVEPGSVTVLGVIHDTNGVVHVVIDQSIWDNDAMQCHPLVNTGTLVIPHAGIELFLKATNHTPRVIEVPARE